jgi:hypothetical protein
MYEYCKEILTKVSFEHSLFEKELNKSLGWLKNEEKILLMVWCIHHFGNRYDDVIAKAFNVEDPEKRYSASAPHSRPFSMVNA